MTRRIRLSDGRFATADSRFYERLVAMGSWYVSHYGYVVRNARSGRKRTVIMMHRTVWSLAGRKTTPLIDHRNQRKRDNRISNLRRATIAQNQRNRRRNINNTSGYKGVGWDKDLKKWRAKITMNHRTINLGSFSNRRQAARAYDRAARKYHGAFCSTNDV